MGSEIGDRDSGSASRAGGYEALAGGRQHSCTAATIGGGALIIGANGLGGTAELAMVEERAGLKKRGIAGRAGWSWALALGTERKEESATLEAML